MFKRRKIKIYEDQNVYDAAVARLEYIFTHFPSVCFSFSGGKDSSVMVQLAHLVAKRMGKKFSVLYIDLEAMYEETTRHVREVKELISDTCDSFFWSCLPLVEDNAVSALQPEFITWDETAKDKWVRELPPEALTTDNHPFDFYDGLMDFTDFLNQFARWFKNKKGGGPVAIVVGLRTDESLRRFCAITSEGKPCFNGKRWTTEVQPGVYQAYPLYDWSVGDIWKAVFKNDFKYNYIYELMYKNGVLPSQQRICQPFGLAQKAGLDQYRVIEPQTWARMLDRVSGVNFGAIYCRTSLLGSISSMKPVHMTWQQYAVYLLESLGIYEPRIMERYYRKIKYYMKWCEKNMGIPYGTMADDADKSLPSWREVARAIEKNDFFMISLSFGYDKAGDELLKELRQKHRLVGEGHVPPMLIRALKKQDAI
jgi:predicted phosphoadenosine phosphosulfate sulfurtransferase